MLRNNGIIRAAIVSFMFMSILVTNRYVNFDTAIMNGFSDVSSYTAIAKAFPHLPKSVAMYHHAQRFFFPYIIGMVSHSFGISLYASFMMFTVIILLATLYVMDRILDGVSEAVYALCMALIIFNPYLFRLYLFSPGMITDLMFLFGTSVVILGLVKDSSYILLTGSVVAILARQTAVVFIPGFFIWLIFSESFGNKKFKNKFLIYALSSVVIVILYKVTGAVASIFGGENINQQHLFTIIPYIKNLDIMTSIRTLKGLIVVIHFFVDLIIRDTFSLILSASVLVTASAFYRKDKTLPKELWLMILFALLIMSQPVMQGHPESATRLVSHAVVPLVTGIALLLSNMPSLKSISNTYTLCLLCYVGSFHHYYSLVRLVIPSFSNYLFALLHYIVVAVVFALLWRGFFNGKADSS